MLTNFSKLLNFGARNTLTRENEGTSWKKALLQQEYNTRSHFLKQKLKPKELKCIKIKPKRVIFNKIM